MNRRTFIELAASSAVAVTASTKARAQQYRIPTRPIPATGEQLPVIGLGTADEFDYMPLDGGEELKTVIWTLLEQGGTIVDTSPAYRNAEAVVGQLLGEMGLVDSVFLSTKIRTSGADAGIDSLEHSQTRLRTQQFDVVFVHDLVDVHTQLANIRTWRDAGRVRYIGVSTSELPHFDDMEALINSAELDFIQINYGVADTLAGERVIPAAADRGVAVMINSPFGDGRYFERVRGHELPDWADEFDCESWAQFSLKYILANSDVTCVIPATSNPAHLIDNARAGSGRLPDTAMRRRMTEYLRDL